MFNKLKKKKTMYTSPLNELLEDVFLNRKTPSQVYTNRYSNLDVELQEDGKQKVTINTIGHNPKDIKVDVTEDEVVVKATKGEETSRFVKDIDLILSVGKDYDGTKSEAKFENGLLTLLIDKKTNKKGKTLKISY